jgi:quercetin dioxygenase-like cupin family protein
MQVRHYSAVPAVEVEGMPGVTVRWVITEQDGAPHFAMRLFEVPPGWSTEDHVHWWEHEVFVLGGSGYVRADEGRYPLREGTVAFIPGGERHQLVNDGDDALRFICLVPHPRLESASDTKPP